MAEEMIRYILVADSHLPDEPAGTEEFFSMLDSLARFASSFEKEKRPSLVFLGDIFELWIALPGYEKESHRRFLDWCGRHKEEFPVLFVEGNHEFFVSFLHRKSFTFCTANRIRENDTVFLHGDLVNLSDWKYRSLRVLLRNPVTALLLYLFAGFGGKALAEKVRMKLKGTNLENKNAFPRSFLEKRASSLFRKEGGTLVSGHFHDGHVLCSKDGSRRICVLPAWESEQGLVGLLAADGTLSFRPWREAFLPREERSAP